LSRTRATGASSERSGSDDAVAAVEEYLRERVGAEEIPGASWVVAGDGGVVAQRATGCAVVVPERVPADSDTIYDLASLTKPLVTSFLFLRLRGELGISGEDAAWRFLPEIDRGDKRDITLFHLLTHTGGMPDWIPFYVHGSTPREYLLQLRDLPPESRPGTRVVYSCAGYIMLGEILARASGVPLDRLAEEVLLRPLGLRHTAFNPPRDWLPRVAATEDSCDYERKLAGERAARYGGFRRGVIRGEVHDQNAWVLGGVAGNAGLFSTARETALMAAEFLGDGAAATGGLLPAQAIELARTDRTPGLNEARSLAFRIARDGETAAGPDLPAGTFGHNGFTGTSVWIDPRRRRLYVLLTNRIHPRASDKVDMLRLRQRFHSLASRI